MALIPLAVAVATAATMARSQILAQRLAMVAGSIMVMGLLLLMVVSLFG
ncbi:hypothetical protein MOQ72_12525 [Saccharopolyspora sp. K220]|nr:hypothetical protein [Saccharopolyspora soli]MCI2418256.1 hypothetical protein [Saccharopolyspora soli]